MALGRFGVASASTLPPQFLGKKRRPALGRSNLLFVGNEDAGHNLATLYTLVATYQQHGVNPLDYLTDVLTRVQRHPNNRIVELFPQNWKPPDPDP